MPETSDLLLGISRGYFKRRQEVEKQEFEQEQQAKDFALQSLLKIAPDVTPETRPLLYRQLIEVAGAKGRGRSFLERLAGTPDRSIRDQVSGSMSDFLSKVVGPEEFKRRKGGLSMTPTEVPVGGQGLPELIQLPGQITQRPDTSQGLVSLRDPLQEQLSLYTSKEAIEAQNKAAQIAQKESLMLKRQMELEMAEAKFRTERDFNLAQYKAQEKVRARAWLKSGGIIPTSENWTQAALELAEEEGLKGENLRARTDYYKARAEEARAMAQGMGTTGIKAGEQERIDAEKRRFDQTQQQRAIDARRLFDQSDAEVKRIESELVPARKAYEDIVATLLDSAKTPADKENLRRNLSLVPMVQVPLAKVNKLEGERAKAISLRDASALDLGTKFGEFYNVNPRAEGGFDVTPKFEFGGVAPSGAPRVAPSRPVVPGAPQTQIPETQVLPPLRPQVPITPPNKKGELKIGISENRPASRYQVGQTIRVMGRDYEVVQINTASTDYFPNGHIVIKPVR